MQHETLKGQWSMVLGGRTKPAGVRIQEVACISCFDHSGISFVMLIRGELHFPILWGSWKKGLQEASRSCVENYWAADILASHIKHMLKHICCVLLVLYFPLEGIGESSCPNELLWICIIFSLDWKCWLLWGPLYHVALCIIILNIFLYLWKLWNFGSAISRLVA